MAIFNVFKKEEEKERFEKKRGKKKADVEDAKEAKKGSPADKSEKKEKKEKASKKQAEKKEGKDTEKILSSVLIGPHITEKSTVLKERGVYVFKVNKNANKITVRQEIKKAHGIAPVKVSINYILPKKKFVRGRHGTSKGYKKAMVYLKKGDKIEI